MKEENKPGGSARWVRRLAAVVLGLFLLFVLLLAVAHIPVVQRSVFRRVQSELRDGYTVDLKAADFSYNLFTLAVRMEEVTVASTVRPDLPPLATADHLLVDLSWGGLLFSVPTVEQARIDGLSLAVIFDAEGGSNLPAPPPTQEVPAADPLSLDVFLIKDLAIAGKSLRFEDRGIDLTLDQPGWNLSIAGELLPWRQNISFETSKAGTLAYQGHTLPLDAMNLAGRLEPQGIQVDKLAVSLGELQVSAAGSIAGFDDPTLDLNLKVAGTLEELRPWIPVDEVVEGSFAIELALRNRIEALRVELSLQGEGLRYGRFRDATLQARATWLQPERKVQLESIELDSPQGSFQANGTLGLAPDAPGNLEAKLQRVSLPAVARQFDLPVIIASNLTAGFSGQGPGLDFQQWTGSGSASLATLQAEPAENVLPVSGDLRFTMSPGRISVQTGNLRALGAELAANLNVADLEKLAGNLEVALPDLGQTLAQADRFRGIPEETPTAPVAVTGGVKLSSTLSGSLDNPRAAFTLDAPALTIGEISGVALTAEGDYTGAELKLANARVDWQEQSVVLAAKVGLEGDDPAIDVTLQIAAASIEAVRQGLAIDAPVAGAVDLTATVTGTMAQPSAELRATVSNLEAYSETWGQLTLAANYAEDTISLSELRLEKPLPGGGAGELTASGAYQLESGAYSVAAKSGDFRIESLDIPGTGAFRAGVSLDVSGEGSLESPALNVRLGVDDATLDDRSFGAINLIANVADQLAIVNVEAPKYSLSADARIGLPAPHAAEVDLRLAGLDLTRLEIPGPDEKPLSGTVAGQILAKGDLDNWQQARVDARIDELRTEVRGQVIESVGPLQATLDGGRLQVSPTLFALGDLRAALMGNIPIDQTGAAGDITVGVNGPLSALLAFAPPIEGLEAGGTIELGLIVQGSLEDFEPTASFGITGANLNHPSLPKAITGFTLRSEARDGEFRLQSLQAEFAGSTITGEGIVPFELLKENPSGEATASIRLEGLDLAALEMLPEPITGNLGAQIEISAGALELEAVRASLTLDPLQVNLGNVALRQDGPATLHLADGVVRVDAFRLAGGSTVLEMKGTAELGGEQNLDFRLSGQADAGLSSVFVEDLRVTGATTFEVAAVGTLEDPKLSGRLDLSNGQLFFPSLAIRAENLNLAIRLAGERIEIERFDARLNGGRVEASGGLAYREGGLQDIDITAKVNNIFVEAPEGLQTLSDADLHIRESGGFVVVGGDIKIHEGAFRKQINITDLLSSGGGIEFIEDRDPFFSRLRFDVNVETLGPIVVDNQLAQLTASADLNLVGNYYRPSITGRIELEEGGELYLAERRYLIETGSIDFYNENRIEPNLNLVARTEAGRWDIDMRLSGPVADLDTTFTADPYLDEGDILAVLLTGRTLDDAQDRGSVIVREQALSLVTGQLAGRLSRGAQESLGLSQVRIEPNLIAAESDPTARLTIGQDLSREAHLTYSIDLVNSADQIWIAEYDVTRRFASRGVRQSDNTYRFDFEHSMRFGGDPEQRRDAASKRDRSEIGELKFEGTPELDLGLLRERVKLKSGKEFDFFEARRGVERLEKLYRKNDFLESRISLNQEKKQKTVDLTYAIEAGPVVEFIFEGRDVDNGVRDQVREAWNRGVFDLQRAEESAGLIRRSLIKKKYYEATVSHEIKSLEEGRKRVIFTIESGSQFRDAEWVFEGAEGVRPKDLADVIKSEPGAALDVFESPASVTDLLTRYYREQGYLQAAVRRPRRDLDADTGVARVVFPIEEGPLYRFGSIAWRGQSAFTDRELSLATTVAEDDAYEPERIRNSVERLEELYWSRGYNDVLVEYQARRNEQQRRVEIAFQITENQQGVVREVSVTGTRDVSESFVRKRIVLEPGDPLDFDQNDRTRRSLYNTGAFSLIEINEEELPGENTPAGEKPVRLLTRVREVTPYRLRYGALFDTERGPGFILDAENRNSLLGGARMIGMRTRYDSDLKEGRAYFGQPFFFKFPSMATVNTFIRREDRPLLVTDRIGFSLQHELELRRDMILNYGYRFEKNHTFEREPDPFLPLDETLNVAPLTSSFSWDTRDAFLDATRGMFTSHGFEYAPASLGSEIQFVKYFGQFFHYYALSEPSEIPFSRGLKKPRVIWANAARVGVAKGLGGQNLFSSERFFAGGGTTVRGFKQNQLGPTDFLGDPLGGDAVFVANTELRFPLKGLLEGVGFLDAGNVFERIGDFNPFDVRTTAGAGLRVRTPFIMVRLDYGFKLDRKTGESRGAFFFSIGQAF